MPKLQTFQELPIKIHWRGVIPVEKFILKEGEQVNMHKQAWMWWHELQQQHNVTKVGVQAPSFQSRAAEPQSSPSQSGSTVLLQPLQLHPSREFMLSIPEPLRQKKRISAAPKSLLEFSFHRVYKFIPPRVMMNYSKVQEIWVNNIEMVKYCLMELQ